MNETSTDSEPIFAYALLNARIMPDRRCEQYEGPLTTALEENGFGELTGGGTMQAKDGEIEHCGVDIDLHDVTHGVPFVCDLLTKLGAPKGSKLQFEQDGQSIEVPFGCTEGLAIYLNGTDLPDEVYQQCRIEHVCDEISRRLGDRGQIQGYWRGPTETALYLYGPVADEMRKLIAGFLAEYPLCQRARIERIA